MENILFDELNTLDFTLTDINARALTWGPGENFDYTLTGRERNSLMYVDSGSVELLLPESKITASAGSLVFLPIKLRYRAFFSAETRIYLASFSFVEQLPAPGFCVISDNATELKPAFDELAQLYISPNTSKLQFKSCFYSLLWESVKLARQSSKVTQSGISAALHRIEANPLGDFSEHELAALCNMSVPTLIRAVKLYTGMTPKRYALSIVMEKAKELLSGGIYSVGEISNLLGFSSPSHFGASFKRAVGMTPGEYMHDSAKTISAKTKIKA